MSLSFAAIQMDDANGIHVERRPPEKMFALLGNQMRVDVLRELAAADEPLGFSALRERVGVRDSGQFNYHLGKLTGAFVRHGDEGYELTVAGLQVVGALVAGTYTAEASLDPIEVDDPCPSCGERPLIITYEDEHARMNCPACEEYHNQFSFPPGTLDQYDCEELPMAFDRWLWVLFGRITAGFCANCAGRLTGTLLPEEEMPAVEWTCERCGDVARASVATPVLHHPATQGFLHDQGADPLTTPSWRLFSMREVDVSADADGASVILTLDGETLTATVGPMGRVRALDRTGG